MTILSDRVGVLFDNPEPLRVKDIISGIVERIIKDVTTSVTKSVEGQAVAQCDAAIRDTVIVPAAIVIALGIVLLATCSLIRLLRVLCDGALKVARTGLESQIAQARSAAELIPE
ncbi:hypothetical protein [Mycobacterium uberis]|uniref:hypothetical protein n=1 Tax=Mycobacterium uberis TaxID=2162698 RepID=UPI001058F93B|nr:hypothetical protein [Mycobacterium uberis]